MKKKTLQKTKKNGKNIIMDLKTLQYIEINEGKVWRKVLKRIMKNNKSLGFEEHLGRGISW